MRIAIVGAGVIGVTTAYELAADGHEVTVYERHRAAAEDASFGTPGLVAPGWLAGLSGAGAAGSPRAASAWRLALRWLTGRRRRADPGPLLPSQERWITLAHYSRDRLQALTEALRLHYDCSPGTLLLLRSERELAGLRTRLPALEAAGVRHALLGAEEAHALEPGMNTRRHLAGALQLPDDGVANCREVTLLLRRQAQALGARFVFRTTVQALDPTQPRRLRLASDEGAEDTQVFDAVVACSGAPAATLLASCGLPLAWVPRWSYAIGAPIGEELNAPRSAVVDWRHGISISRLGQRLRVSGWIETDRRAGRQDPAALRSLYQVLQDWFPAGAQLSGACTTVQEWKGALPTLRDGLPRIGPSGLPGLWLNLGHGRAGWTLACGSARLLADQVAGRTPEVSL